MIQHIPDIKKTINAEFQWIFDLIDKYDDKKQLELFEEVNNGKTD